MMFEALVAGAGTFLIGTFALLVLRAPPEPKWDITAMWWSDDGAHILATVEDSNENEEPFTAYSTEGSKWLYADTHQDVDAYINAWLKIVFDANTDEVEVAGPV